MSESLCLRMLVASVPYVAAFTAAMVLSAIGITPNWPAILGGGWGAALALALWRPEND